MKKSKSTPKKTAKTGSKPASRTKPKGAIPKVKKTAAPAKKSLPKKTASKSSPAKRPLAVKKPSITKKTTVKKVPVSKKPAAVKTAPKPIQIKTKSVAAAAKKTVSKASSTEIQPSTPPALKTVSKTESGPEKKPVKKASAGSPPPGPTKSGALFYDSHMHTPLCKHAWGEPEEYAQQALKSGLKGIIFTCHCPMPDGFWPSVRMSESEFDTYLALVQRAADAFKGKLDIRLGIESEYYPGCEEYIEQLHQRADFHYVLGAVHWQAKEYLNKYETGTIENFRRTYFEHLAKSAESGLYDCLAHPDLVKNYHPDSWCFAIVKNTVTAALDRIAATGVAMELNTSGLNKSYSEMNPGDEMLAMMAERKIPVVIGSDSHRAQRVGEHFVTALNKLTEAGYEKVSYFLNRQRIDLKISEVLASLKKAADHNA